jgi:hypothetical protein
MSYGSIARMMQRSMARRIDLLEPLAGQIAGIGNRDRDQAPSTPISCADTPTTRSRRGRSRRP